MGEMLPLDDDSLLEVEGGGFALFAAAVGAGYIIGRAIAHIVQNYSASCSTSTSFVTGGGGGGVR